MQAAAMWFDAALALRDFDAGGLGLRCRGSRRGCEPIGCCSNRRRTCPKSRQPSGSL